jgi:hypothetical protein
MAIPFEREFGLAVRGVRDAGSVEVDDSKLSEAAESNRHAD